MSHADDRAPPSSTLPQEVLSQKGSPQGLLGEAEGLLSRVFGFDTWRPNQREIVTACLSGRDVLAVLPTGGGKSLCYQLPALIRKELVLVVSPLIALMRDQILSLREIGVGASALNSELGPEAWREEARAVREGRTLVLYAAPEALGSDRFQELLRDRPPFLLAVDEAHCISQWGHDFRPDYRKIAELRALFPKAACLAVTATATDRVREDIVRNLALHDPLKIVASFDRPNLRIAVEPKQDASGRLLALARSRPGEAGIVYCLSRRGAEEAALRLRKAGIPALPYHAGLSKEERSANQEAFIRDDIRVVCATVAFGMGVDKPDVRYVVHMDLPKDIEGYYQEIGRAGRDGLPADCLLFYSYGDAAKLRRLFADMPEEARRGAEERLRAMVAFAEGRTCRKRAILAHFGEAMESDCGQCDVCRLGPEAMIDLTVPAQKLLSAVARTGGRFGVAHLVDVLLGLETEKTLRHGHGSLPTFGVGKDLPRSAWSDLARRLLAAGLLREDPEYRTVALSDRGLAWLRAREPFSGPPLDRRERKGGVRTPAAKAVSFVSSGEGGEGAEELFLLLRKRRKALADASGIPPYVVFPDRTLKEIALRRPASLAELGELFGVGERKLERYGRAMLEVVEAWKAG